MPRLTREKSQQLQAQFKKFDRSGDGILDFKEMCALLRRGNPNLTDKQLRTLFQGIDKNKDGTVDFNEFVAYLYDTPEDSEENEPPEPSEDVKMVFHTFAGGPTMDGARFAKLCRDCRLLGASLAACDVDTIFAKVTPKGKKAIQFPGFLKALVVIAEKKEMDIQDLYCQVGDAAPVTRGTKADSVRLHDDKSTYVGTQSVKCSPKDGASHLASQPGGLLVPAGRRQRLSSPAVPAHGSGAPRQRSPSPSPSGSPSGGAARGEGNTSFGFHSNAETADEPLPDVPEEDLDWNLLTRHFFDFAGRGEDVLDGRAFAKLCSDCGLYDQKFTKRDVDIIFQKALFKGERRTKWSKQVAQYFVHNAVLKSNGPVLHGTKAEGMHFHGAPSPEPLRWPAECLSFVPPLVPQQIARKGREVCLGLIPHWDSPKAMRRRARFGKDRFRPLETTKVFVVSDVHYDYPANEEWCSCIHATRFQDDILIVSGNLADSYRALTRALTTLRAKFRRVFYVPGNHEMWIPTSEAKKFPDSLCKLWAIMELCDELDVDIFPAAVCKDVYVVPLLSWYNVHFDMHDPFPDPKSAADKYAKWPIDKDGQVWRYMLRLNQEHLCKPYHGTVITVSHFLPRRQLPVWREKNIYKTSGCGELDEQVREARATCHIYGHSGYRHNQVHEEVTYMHRPLQETVDEGQKDPILCIFNGRNICSDLVPIH